MSEGTYTFTVFTKPWKMALPKLGELVSRLGFDGVELPVRPGYQVEPERVLTDLPRAAITLAEFGLKIGSVAGPIDEPTIVACAEVGIPVIRICPAIPKDTDYFTAIDAHRRQWDAVLPLLERYGVKIGVQNHCDRFIGSAMQVYHAIQGYDPRYIAAVWDPAHCALVGEPPSIATDILHDRLCMVNLKNAMWRDSVAPESEHARWKVFWTTGRRGLANWEDVVAVLKRRGWSGTICLCAEYSQEEEVEHLTGQDYAYARTCFGVK